MAMYSAAPDFDDYDDEEMVATVRPANVPTGRVMRQPGPAFRVAGDPMTQPARPVAPNVPQPLSGAGVRPRPVNVPSSMSPAMQRSLAPSVGANDPYARRQPRRNMLSNLNIAAGLLNVRLILTVGAVVGVFILGFFLISNVLHWWQTWQDDMTYGRPRTSQTDAWVGHNEQGGTPSHFIAQNINHQVIVYEVPGGDPLKTRVIQGPPLYFKDSDLAPVTLSFRDVNADGHVDMLVSVEGQQFIYINDNGNFRRITSEEQARINLNSGGSK